MVCLPCIIYPFFLWLWYEWIYPYVKPFVVRFWDNNKEKILGPSSTNDKQCPGAAVDGKDGEVDEKTKNQTAAKCPLSLGKKDS